MIQNLNHLECITLFVDDLKAAKEFYTDIFGLKSIFEDPQSCVVKMENVFLNLLQRESAPELIAPQQIGASTHGPRMMFTLMVKDVDGVLRQLQSHRVKILNGPIDRPWGRRTAAFVDPSGHAWEVAQEIH